MRAGVSRRTRRVLVVGAGLTGATVARSLADGGWTVVVHEALGEPGGLIRSSTMEGVVFEPHGSHIFHTNDREVWEYVNRFVPFNDYRHEVKIMIEGKLLHWPISVDDIAEQSCSDQIRRELAERANVDADDRAVAANFEEWCLELMGPTLYARYVYPYTKKQWGREPRGLRASWAPRRVQVRPAGDHYLFRDAHQGWPAGREGYTDLIEALLNHARIDLVTGSPVTRTNLLQLCEDADARRAVLTCPLDVFSDFELGRLDWRGIIVSNVYLPHLEFAQAAMVVNYPALEYPFIRVHETKHASRQQCDGTVLGFEFCGAPTRYYPVNTPENDELNARYQALIRRSFAPLLEIQFAGRLANYAYINMDECVRQALDTAEGLAGADTPSEAA
jgi:UDP-galactopyranose mutase